MKTIKLDIPMDLEFVKNLPNRAIYTITHDAFEELKPLVKFHNTQYTLELEKLKKIGYLNEHGKTNTSDDIIDHFESIDKIIINNYITRDVQFIATTDNKYGNIQDISGCMNDIYLIDNDNQDTLHIKHHIGENGITDPINKILGTERITMYIGYSNKIGYLSEPVINIINKVKDTYPNLSNVDYPEETTNEIYIIWSYNKENKAYEIGRLNIEKKIKEFNFSPLLKQKHGVEFPIFKWEDAKID